MKTNITYKELHRQLMYNPWTGIFYRKYKKAGYEEYSIAGTQHSDGCIAIEVNKQIYKAHRLAWLYVNGYFPENNIDHKDRIRNHNWIKNLRDVTQVCNIRNTGNFAHNTSGVKGVSWAKHAGKWAAHIMVNQKGKYLGIYKKFHNAVCARLAAEQCLDWDGCDSHSPAYQYVKENILL